MSIHFQDATTTLHHGDCLAVMAELPDASVDAIVTDPPYGLGFMGRAWDALPPGLPWAQECLRVLKPGGHLLAFGGTRTWHRLAVAVEDAGFEVRDSIAWMYGSGFPKSLDVSKAIDKARDDKSDVLAVTARLADLADAAGIARIDVDSHMGTSDMGGWWLSRLPHRCACPSVENWTRLRDFIPGANELDDAVWQLNGRKGTWGNERSDRIVSLPAGNAVFQPTQRVESSGSPATPDAERWQGWGTALKPAFEPIVVARKPPIGTVAANVLAHGTGALNVDGCRIESDGEMWTGDLAPSASLNGFGPSDSDGWQGGWTKRSGSHAAGRWPANVILDESQAEALDEQSGHLHGAGSPREAIRDASPTGMWSLAGDGNRFGDTGGASRFFYTAKADAGERPRIDGVAHPTVKPLALMRWLVRLVTPPGGVVLEPFAGSGTTVEACILEGFQCIAIEREADYLPLIVQRINRRRDPVAAIKATGDDGGLFELFGEASA